MYDVIVVGGGPSGATCARYMARYGLKVVLIDKDEHPRPKLCGGALNPRVTDLLDLDISEVVDSVFHAAVVYPPSGKRIVMTSEGLTGYLVKRPKFDKFLLEQAEEEGVEVVSGLPVLSIEQVKRGIRALCEGDSFKGHLLVGADGANSVVAKSTGIRSRWPSGQTALCIAADIPYNVGLENMFNLNKQIPMPIEIHYDIGKIDWGYGWVFPKSDEVSIGIGCRQDRAQGLRRSWKKFISHLEKKWDTRLDLPKTTAARVPFGESSLRSTARRTMLVGDAAGLVSPISGEGIYYAIKSGKIAAYVAKRVVDNRSPGQVVNYQKELTRRIFPELEAAAFISKRMYKSRTSCELVCSLAEKDEKIRELMVEFLIGARSIAELKIAITKRMMTRHPLKALRLLY